VHYLITSEIYWQKEATPKSELKAKRKAALQCTNRERQLANSVVTCPAAAKIPCPENNLRRPITVCVCAVLYSLSCTYERFRFRPVTSPALCSVATLQSSQCAPNLRVRYQIRGLRSFTFHFCGNAGPT
jgi:hypothetical protein